MAIHKTQVCKPEPWSFLTLAFVSDFMVLSWLLEDNLILIYAVPPHDILAKFGMSLKLEIRVPFPLPLLLPGLA